MKFTIKDDGIWVKMESMDDVRLVLTAQEVKEGKAEKAVKKPVAITSATRRKKYRVPCDICGKKFKGMKIHKSMAHQKEPANALPAWITD